VIIDALHPKTTMKHIIYSIFNTVTGRYYIGSTTEDLWYIRRHNHVSQLKKGIHHSFKLQSSWKRHGEKAFVFQILEDNIDNLELRTERENFWINHFDSFKKGYNCKEATSGNLFTKESREKLSNKRKQMFKEGLLKNPNPRGEKRDSVLMAKINAKKKVPVYQYDKDMNFIKEWEGVADATKYYNLSKNCIFNCLRKGIDYTAGGFKWKYKNG
jgi:hypothetical protein